MQDHRIHPMNASQDGGFFLYHLLGDEKYHLLVASLLRRGLKDKMRMPGVLFGWRTRRNHNFAASKEVTVDRKRTRPQ